MKVLLGILVVLATFMTLGHAQCYIIPKTRFPNDFSDECRDANGITHPLNSRWKTENCETCFCSQQGINCCNIAVTPVNYDTVKCKKIFNKETCSYTVVERKDPKKACDVSGWVV